MIPWSSSTTSTACATSIVNTIYTHTIIVIVIITAISNWRQLCDYYGIETTIVNVTAVMGGRQLPAAAIIIIDVWLLLYVIINEHHRLPMLSKLTTNAYHRTLYIRQKGHAFIAYHTEYHRSSPLLSSSSLSSTIIIIIDNHHHHHNSSSMTSCIHASS